MMTANEFFRAGLITFAAGTLCASVYAGYPGAPEAHKHAAEHTVHEHSSGTGAGISRNMELLSFLPLDGVVTDVWAHRNYAYVGGYLNFSTFPDPPEFTPVRIIDISDPEDPEVVAELPTPPGSSPQDVKVAKIKTDYFRGDLLVVGNDGGDAPPFGGLQLVDVSDPRNPVILSEPRIGPVHNMYLYQRGKRAYVLLAISFGEVFSKFFPPFIDVADFAIVDVTDPRNPQLLTQPGDPGRAGWFALDAGFPVGAPFPFFPPPYQCDETCRGDDFPGVFNHDVWANKKGTIAYASYWDLGLIMLDISDPASPTLIGRGIEPPTFGSDEGNAHNAVPARNGKLVLVADEDFTPLPFGFLRIFDTSEPTNPVQVGAYATQNSVSQPEFFPGRSIHNIVTRGSRAFISWYYDGIRVVDFSRPSNPREIAAFMPESGPPNGDFWGVYQHRGLILGSDFGGFSGGTGGLYILELDCDDDDCDGDDDDDDDD